MSHDNKGIFFIIDRSEIKGRLDPKMALYNKKVQHSVYPKIQLKNLLLCKPQYGANEIGVARKNNNTPRYIRITDINEYGLISLDEYGATVENVEDKYLLNENDILIARSGATVGKTYIHKTLPYPCIFAGYLIRFVVDPSKILPDFLFVYTQLTPYKEWVNAIQRPTAQPNINAEEYQSLEIPLPEFNMQKQIVGKIKLAYSHKKEKELKAQQLLDGINGYILDELGIILPEIQTDLKNRIFYAEHKNCITRLDPKYNKQILYIKSLSCKYSWTTLAQVILNTGQYGANEAAIDFKDGDIRYIRITDIDEDGNLKNFDKKTAANIECSYLLHKNDVLFARSGSVGRCYIHKNDNEPAIFAGYLIRFMLNTEMMDPWFLFYYCNSSIYKYWVDTIQRPAVQANINAEEYRSMIIPLPPLSKQKKIVEHINAIRQEAELLRRESKMILEKAKQDVEQMILGNDF